MENFVPLEKTFEIDGIAVTVRYLDSGTVYGCSDWGKIHKLEEAGHVVHHFFPFCWNHVDYFIADLHRDCEFCKETAARREVDDLLKKQILEKGNGFWGRPAVERIGSRAPITITPVTCYPMRDSIKVERTFWVLSEGENRCGVFSIRREAEVAVRQLL